MPGPIAHQMVVERVLQNLSTPMNQVNIPENQPYLKLGSQGPDFLFFNARDWPTGDGFADKIGIALDIQDTLKEIKKVITDILPIDEIKAIDETVRDNSIAWNVLRDTQDRMNQVKNIFEKLIQKSIERALIGEFADDMFELLGHPEQNESNRYKSKENWWWFDTLHYRKTGQFTSTLLRKGASQGFNSKEFAYALGYSTHFATDVVGHPYVNMISSGPFRTHSQRHKTVENYHDSWLYKEFNNQEELVRSSLYKQYKLQGTETQSQLDESIGNLIRDSMSEVYHQGCPPYYGTLPSTNDLNNAYRMWLQWFEMATTAFDDIPEPIPYSINEELQDALNRFKDHFDEIEKSFDPIIGSRFSIKNFFKFLAASIAAAVRAIFALVDFVVGLGAILLTATIKSFLSLVYQELYNIFIKLHDGIAKSGLAFPLNNNIEDRFTEHFFNSTITDNQNNSFESIESYYPLQKFQACEILEKHLIYPLAYRKRVNPKDCDSSFLAESVLEIQGELSESLFGPPSYKDIEPSYFLFDAGPTNQSFYNAMANINDPYTYNNEVRFRLAQGESLGSAVDFSLFLLNNYQSGIADFNLDGDRGYAMKSWRLKSSQSELEGTDEDFPTINQVEENPDSNIRTTIQDIL